MLTSLPACPVLKDAHLWARFHFRWRRLKAQMIEKRSKLGESQTLQQFSRDVDEIEAWISEKLQTASDESYKDPTNIQVSRCQWPLIPEGAPGAASGAGC